LIMYFFINNSDCTKDEPKERGIALCFFYNRNLLILIMYFL